MKKTSPIHLFFLFFIFYMVMTLQGQYATSDITNITYSEFKENMEKGNVTDVTITGDRVQGSFKDPIGEGKTRFTTTLVQPEIAQEFDKYGVNYSRVIENTFFKDLFALVFPILLFVGIWVFFIRRAMKNTMGQGGPGGSFMGIGKSK